MESQNIGDGKNTSRQRRRSGKTHHFFPLKKQNHTGRLLAALRQRLAGQLQPLPERCLGEEEEEG